MSRRFNLGDGVYFSEFNRQAIAIPCPDCFGRKKLRVILGDGTEVEIDCVGCACGYDPPVGTITQYEWKGLASYQILSGIEEREENGEKKYRYYFVGGKGDYEGDRTFAIKEEALAKANMLQAEYEQEENRRLMAKTKDKRSWAWNVSYHRSCIRRAQRELEYHQAKARICEAKSLRNSNALGNPQP